MADEALVQAGDESHPRSLALSPSGGLEQHNGDWNAAALAQPAVPTSLDPTVYLHAFRRHWLLSLGIGLACAAVAFPAVFWLAIGEKFTASSYLQLEVHQKSIFEQMLSTTDREGFDIFKNTQQQLVLSRPVLMAALRKPDVAKIPAIQEAQRSGDAVDWLQKRLFISFPGKAQYMEVSVTRPNAHEAAVLVNAVVDSYLTDVIKAEGDAKRERLNKLESACADKEQQIRSKRQELKSLAQINGVGTGTEVITQKQRMIVEEYGLRNQHKATMGFTLGDLESQLVAQKALVKSVDSTEPPAEEVDMLVRSDPVSNQLAIQLAIKKQEEAMNSGAVTKGSKNRYADRYKSELEMLQRQYDEKLAEAKKKVQDRRRMLVTSEALKLQMQFDVKKSQYEALVKQVEKLKEEAAKFGNTTVDIEMLNSDLKQLDVIASQLNAEKEKIRVELSSAPRITLIGGPAEDPRVPSNWLGQIAATVLVVLAVFCCPAVIVVLYDIRAHRINNTDDVSHGLHLPVIGSVPLIPQRVLRQLGSPSQKHQSWHLRLTESVDGITARVLHKAEVGQCRVIMVSSAAGGEGKTTLATQLAMSLARTKRRVVLVDFDLRRPNVNGEFNLPLEPGVCEALRRQNAICELSHPSGTENLDVVTAGRWDRHALASLSNGSAGAMFQELRGAYDFVVVDTSPLLPVADARFVSQHVDAVVLSVRRDVSQAPKIQAACDILAAFGVQSVEAVVTGASQDLYGHHDGYTSTISA
jgi:polysaccharide biosynthesis transport protein